MPGVVWHVSRPAEGGILTYLESTLGGFESRIWQVILVGPVVIPGIRTVPCDLVDGLHPRADALAARTLRLAAQENPPAIIHCHGAKAALVVRLAFPWGAPPIIYSVHYPPRAGLFSHGERLLARRVSLFLAPTRSVLRSMLDNWGVAPDRARVAPQGLSRARLKELIVHPRSASQAGRKVRISVLARLVPEKGIDVLLDACQCLAASQAVKSGQVMLPDVRVAGGGPLRQQLEKEIRDRQLRHWVSLLGPLLPDEVPEFLAWGDMFVLPSRREALGLSVLEAMAAGCAVVTSDADGLPEVVSNRVTGLTFPSGDGAALASSILLLLKDPSRRAELARKARQRAQSATTAEDHVQILERTYSEVARGGL